MRLNVLGLAAAAAALAPAGSAGAASLPLTLSAWHHITFDGIPPTGYRQDGAGLRMEVARSASFLLQAFPAARPVRHVSFDWRSEGELKIADAATEQTKAGDDAHLKVALLLAGDAPLVPFFAPAWIKAVRDDLKQPTDHMVELVAGAKAPGGAKWPSPYSSSITMLAVASTPSGGWQHADVTFPQGLEVVAVWLMADGDNSGSTFTTWVKALELE